MFVVDLLSYWKMCIASILSGGWDDNGVQFLYFPWGSRVVVSRTFGSCLGLSLWCNMVIIHILFHRWLSLSNHFLMLYKLIFQLKKLTSSWNCECLKNVFIKKTLNNHRKSWYNCLYFVRGNLLISERLWLVLKKSINEKSNKDSDGGPTMW